mgnify:FL=1|tara:strand:+ start:4412 stop:4576 length:165 start_codon:yes stop_codon:yes gene_type:complete
MAAKARFREAGKIAAEITAHRERPEPALPRAAPRASSYSAEAQLPFLGAPKNGT